MFCACFCVSFCALVAFRLLTSCILDSVHAFEEERVFVLALALGDVEEAAQQKLVVLVDHPVAGFADLLLQ